MENLPFILITVMAALVYAAYFYTDRRLSEEQARTAILREHGIMAVRLHVGYCRKLLSDPDKSFVDKDDVLYHMHNVLDVFGYDIRSPRPTDPPKPSDSSLLPPDSSAEGV